MAMIVQILPCAIVRGDIICKSHNGSHCKNDKLGICSLFRCSIDMKFTFSRRIARELFYDWLGMLTIFSVCLDLL